MEAERPPYGLVAVVAGLVLVGYVATLAPTVTLWDAGEFITAAKVLGIPHPPGTPLFVLLAHVWGDVVAVGAYAWRLNLMSACFSAAASGCFFLIIHRLLAGEAPRLRVAGAATATLVSAFTFTVWQNSNETEVYAVATFGVAVICWLALRWRDARGTAEAPRLLLFIVYLAALAVGNHLLTLLVGPALALFIFRTLRVSPAADPNVRRAEWAEWGTVTALWVVLGAAGLGSMPLLLVGGVLCAGAVVYAVRVRSPAFPLAALALGAIGVSTYAFLLVRSGQQPILDEGDPETWSRLLAMIRREQYAPRRPFDQMFFLIGPDKPHRTPRLFVEQLVNYVQYFDWQWARGLDAWRVAVTVLFAALGFVGIRDAVRRDRSVAYLLLVVWLMTSLGVVIYMNFKPGFSLFWERYPSREQHEVLERDYFFGVSFQCWGLLAGLGLATLIKAGRRPLGRPALALAGLALVPIVLNWRPASRRHGADATLAADWAYNLLQSVEPYGVLFTSGDNDTFPLWYAQEVEGVRQDVTVVNLSLANLAWYVQQLQTRFPRAFDPAAAPEVYRSRVPATPPGPVLMVTSSLQATFTPARLGRDSAFRVGGIELRRRAGLPLLAADQVVLFVLAEQLGRRPVAFGLASRHASSLDLDAFLVQQGVAYQVVPSRSDTTHGVVPGIDGTRVDAPRTELLIERVFRYGRLFDGGPLALEPAAGQVAAALALPFVEIGAARAARGDRTGALEYLRRGYHLNPAPEVAALVRRLEMANVERLFRH